MANPDVLAEVARIRKEAATLPGSVLLTLAEKRAALAEIVRCNGYSMGREVTTSGRLRALELDAKLNGELSQKMTVNGEAVIKVTLGD